MLPMLPMLYILIVLTQYVNARVYNVCISSWSPFDFYSPTTNSHVGLDWDIFSQIISNMGLSIAVREVDSWDNMMIGLTTPGSCDFAPSAIPYDNYAFGTPSNLTTVQGSFLSVPTYRDTFSMAVKVKKTEIDIWLWTRMFDASMWIVTVSAAVFLGIMVWVSEKNFYDRGMGKIRYPVDVKGGLYEGFYRVYGKLFNVVSDWNAVSIISKILSISWGIVTVVLMANYTAALTGFLTSDTASTAITNPDEVRTGKYKLLTYGIAQPRMAAYFGVKVDSFYWGTNEDGLNALEKVSSGEYDAMIMDTPFLQYVLAQRCDLAYIGAFLPEDLGTGFNKYLPKEIRDDFDATLLGIYESGMYEMIMRAWLPSSQCSYLNTGAITFYNVAGLWIVIAASLGLSCVIALLPHLSKKLDIDVRTLSVAASTSMRLLSNKVYSLTIGNNAVAPSKKKSSTPSVEFAQDNNTTIKIPYNQVQRLPSNRNMSPSPLPIINGDTVLEFNDK